MMIGKLMWKFGVLAVLIGMGGVAASGASISVNTVGAYAPNPNGLTINNAASNSLSGGITLANFQASVSAAFTANSGGVLDSEVVNGWILSNGAPATAFGDGSANPITANFGTSLSRSISYWRTDVDGSNVPLGIDSSNNNGTNVVSGTNYMGIRGIGSPVNLAFGSGLKQLGLTLVPRGAARTVTLTATLDDASTIVGSAETINADNTPGAYFWGFEAPAGKRIVGLNILSPNGFARFDDMGFVVPEPASAWLVGLAGAVLLNFLRRR